MERDITFFFMGNTESDIIGPTKVFWLVGGRLMVGRSTLNAVIGVQIPAPQPGFSYYNNNVSEQVLDL